MKIKIIEKSTRIEIATENSVNKALTMARRRRVSPGNLLFVVGDPDVQLHDFSSSWASMYRWLANYLIRQSSVQEYFIEAARTRFLQWDLISRSREVTHEDASAPLLSVSIGESLAADVELLVRLNRAADSKVFGPDTKKTWSETVQRGVALSRQFPYNSYVLAIHEKLGALIVAPEQFLQGRPDFKIKKHFNVSKGLVR